MKWTIQIQVGGVIQTLTGYGDDIESIIDEIRDYLVDQDFRGN